MKRVYQSGFNGWGAGRHILFVLTATPVFKIVRASLNIVAEGPVFLNVAYVIPVALAGTINLYVAFRIFLMNYDDKKSALLFTLLYGFAASTWIFSSFPDTHIVTTLATNIFLAILVSRAHVMSSIPTLAAKNALVAYAAPNRCCWHWYPDYPTFRRFDGARAH